MQFPKHSKNSKQQEYLAKKMQATNWACAVDQNKLDITKAIGESMSYLGLSVDGSTNRLLPMAIEKELNV